MIPPRCHFNAVLNIPAHHSLIIGLSYGLISDFWFVVLFVFSSARSLVILEKALSQPFSKDDGLVFLKSQALGSIYLA